MIDFRSDTVTRPGKEMLKAMFSAEVGDDVYGEDPTVNELEHFSAEMFGKEAGLYCPSGTQTNQIALNVHLRPGDEIIIHEESHVYKFEGGGFAKNTGASVHLLSGNRGLLKSEDILDAIKPDDVHFPRTKLVSLENTTNMGGGAIYDFEEIKKIAKVCRENNLILHLDGARLFNALVETNIDYKEFASYFNSISICLSKGLGAPVGSVLLGNKDFIHNARRVRKVFGGGMRQAGIIAAGGLYALKNNIERLKIDHQHAKALGDTLKKMSWVKEILEVETNIVILSLENQQYRDKVIEKLNEDGILLSKIGKERIRFVTHLDISPEQIEDTIQSIKGIKL